jgi:hypothetical protein
MDSEEPGSGGGISQHLPPSLKAWTPFFPAPSASCCPSSRVMGDWNGASPATEPRAISSHFLFHPLINNALGRSTCLLSPAHLLLPE